MNMIEQYSLTLQIEVVKEQSAETLAHLCKLVQKNGTSDCVDALKEFSHIVNTELYMVTSIVDLESLKIDMRELETQIKESVVRDFHGISDGQDFKEIRELQGIESYSAEDFDKALERTIELLTFNKKSAQFTEKECKVLKILFTKKQATKNELLQNVCGYDNYFESKAIETLIYGIKMKLKNNGFVDFIKYENDTYKVI